MAIFAQDENIIIDGVQFTPGMHPEEELVRAVVISIFTWRRALPDDELPGTEKMGWWGDTFPTVINDKIGSRLWLLCRSKLTDDTVTRAREYVEEALQWLIDDGVAYRFDVVSERIGMEMLGLSVQIYRTGREVLDLRFSDIWKNILGAGNNNAI